MKADRVIESAIRAAQNLLWQNLPPTHKLPDAAAIARLTISAHFMSTDQVFLRARRQKQRTGEAFRLRPNRAKLGLLHDAGATLSRGCGPGSGIGEALD